jgi:carboxypeptidase Taq
MHRAYRFLCERFSEMHRLDHLAAICHWDQATLMPAGSNDARAEALAELALVRHRRLTDPALEGWFGQASSASLDPSEQANLREMRRQWQHHCLLPSSLVEARSLAGSRCEHAWREQRRQNDWSGFATHLAPLVELVRQEAGIRAEAQGIGRYDSLLDLYEPGVNCQQLDRLFGDMRGWLVSLLGTVVEHQARETCTSPVGPFPVAAQRELALKVMQQLGFDFRRGRLDISTHPFCGGVPEDVRITTRYTQDDFSRSLMGIIHETGHGCYEQNLPARWLQQPAGQARSMGIHESQSLLFEMQIGRHPAFVHWLSPLLCQAFPATDLRALAVENLARLYTRVRPGLIRVDADEVTYPLHVLLRYEIERALIEGDIEVADIPELWHEKMMAYLGLPTAGNDRDGCMQDIHWADGTFGYFPSYTLGAMAAAQCFGVMELELGGLESSLRAGDLRPVSDWLRKQVWCHGSLLETPALMRQATGEELNPDWFRRHLERRYLAP